MLKLLNLTLGFILVLVIVLAIAMKVGPSLLKGQIESEISSRTGVDTKIGSLQFVQVWPVTMVLRGIRMDNPKFLARISQFQVAASYSQKRWRLNVEVEEPQIRLKEPSPEAAVVPPPRKSIPNVREKARDSVLDLFVHVTGGRIAWASEAQMLAEQIELKFEKRGLLDLTQPGKLHLSGQVQSVMLGLNVRWPMRLDVPDLITDGILLRTAGSTMVIGGMTARFNGASNFVEQSHNWQFVLDVPKIEELPQPPNLLPGSNFRGQVKLSGDFQMNAGVIKAGGDVVVKGASADLKIAQQGLEIEGPVRANFTTEFKYDQMFRLNHLVCDLDMTDARVNFKDMFSKTQQVPLRFTARGASPGQSLEIETVGFEIAQIKGHLTGRVTPKGDYPADLALQVQPTSLAGLEKVLLPLRASPVTGQVALHAGYQGPLNNWRKGRAQLTSMKLTALNGALNWKNQDESIALAGPVIGGITASGVYDNGNLKSAAVAGNLNLQGLQIRAKNYFQKASGQPFNLDLDADATGFNQVHLKKFQLKADWGSMDFVGYVQNPAEPVFDLRLKIPNLSLTGFRQASPFLKEMVPDGMLNGQISMKGTYRFTIPDWYDQNIRLSGNVIATLPEYKMKEIEKPEIEKGGGAAAPAPKATGFLPDGLMTKNLELTVKMKIEKLSQPGLIVNGVLVDGQIKNGSFKGLAQMRQVFDGQVKISGLVVPLLDTHPLLRGAANFTGIKIENAILFSKPDLKDFAFGRVGGQVAFISPMPTEEDFLKRLTANGHAKAEPLTLNSVKVGAMINDMIKKVPGIGEQQVKTDSLKGWAQMTFRLQDKIMELPQFRAMDVDGSELVSTGTVHLDTLMAQLKGTFYWSKPTIKGCLLEGNRDAQGRMQIPIALEGPLMRPELSLVGNLINQLGANALTCERKKFVERLKNEGTEKLQDEVKKKLKSLLGN